MSILLFKRKSGMYNMIVVIVYYFIFLIKKLQFLLLTAFKKLL